MSTGRTSDKDRLEHKINPTKEASKPMKTTDDERLFHRGLGASHMQAVDIVVISRSAASLILRAANRFYKRRTPASLATLHTLVNDAQSLDVRSSHEERPEVKARREAAERQATAHGEGKGGMAKSPVTGGE